MNPGPKSIYPCGLCDLEVTWNTKSIACDTCEVWFHYDCVGLCTTDLERLGGSSVVWLCPRCDSKNCDSFTFNSFMLSLSNYYTPLNETVDSFTFDSPFSPTKTSSPKNLGFSSRSNSARTSSTKSLTSKQPANRPSSSTNFTFHLPKKANLRIMTVNCHSIIEKQSQFKAVLDYVKPDIVCGTESWLRGISPGKPPSQDHIKSSEVFPDYFGVYRNDRSTLGGGVFTLVHKSITSTEQPELVTSCEIEWVKIRLQNTKDLFIGTFYMPERRNQDLQELQKSLNQLTGNNKTARNIILAGDFNCPDVNWDNNVVSLGAQDRAVQQTLVDITAGEMLSQVQARPTRGQNVLDLVFTSNPTLLKSSHTIPGISDHDIVVTDFDTKPHITPPQARRRYKFHRADWAKVKKALVAASETISTMYNKGDDVTALWEFFKSSLQATVNQYIPSSVSRKRTSLPWINAPLRRMLRRKQRLFRRAKQTNDWTSYRNFQKICRCAMRRAEWNFINSKILDGLANKNTKPFWSFVKSRKQDNVGVSPLKDQGNLVSDSQSKARLLLQQFKSVFNQPTNTPPPPVNSPKVSPIDQIQITTAGVEKLLRDINASKATGPDDIPNAVLKNCATEIAPALTSIFQKSLDSSALPSDWLQANISCAYKKGDRHLPSNYRPISLTSVSCKLLEHIICRHLLNHFETHNVLTHLNHGFRSGYSCETQLLTTTQDFLTSLDNRRQVDIAILDYSRAFDTVPHDRLLHKLRHYGIDGSLLQWLTAFLTQRSMRVALEGITSEDTTVDSGVPQGTVLGPILFLCHINDLPNCVKSQVRLFADDCLIYRDIESFQDHQTLQQDLKQLEAWADDWGMSFNATKCYILSINLSSNFLYQLNNTILQHVTENPYLGILLSHDLKWSAHISNISKKASSTLGFLRRNLRRCPASCRKQAYLALVRPLMEYGATVWDPYLQKDIDCLEKIQRRAARFISGDYKSASPGSVTKLLEKTGLQTLQKRRQNQRLTMFYRVVEGLVPALPPHQFLTPQKPGRQIRIIKKKDFEIMNIISGYARNNTRAYAVPSCRTEQSRHSFFSRTVREWNQLDDTIVHAPSVETFKSRLAASQHQ